MLWRKSVFWHATLFALTALAALRATMAAIAGSRARGPWAELAIDTNAILLNGTRTVVRASISALIWTSYPYRGTVVRLETRDSGIALWFPDNDAHRFLERLPEVVRKVERFEVGSPLSVRRGWAPAWEVAVAIAATLWLALGPERSAASRFLQAYLFAFTLLGLGRTPRILDLGSEGVVVHWLWTKSIVPYRKLGPELLGTLGIPDDVRLQIETSIRDRKDVSARDHAPRNRS
jgi:hypothetical protein